MTYSLLCSSIDDIDDLSSTFVISIETSTSFSEVAPLPPMGHKLLDQLARRLGACVLSIADVILGTPSSRSSSASLATSSRT